MSSSISKNGLVVAAAVCAAVAIAVLLTAALLPDESLTEALVPQYEFHKTDEVEFTLEPFQSLEYKYLMDRGSSMVFSWSASGDLHYELHAENTTTANQEESYAQGLAGQHMGAYQARFNGMHGWFWENRGFEVITLRLNTSGFYVNATEYRGGGTGDRSPAPVF